MWALLMLIATLQLTPRLLFISLVAVVGIAAIFSAILMYHWRVYEVNKKLVFRVQVLYLAVLFVLILAAAFFIWLYSLAQV
jgi:hypothetical protein